MFSCGLQSTENEHRDVLNDRMTEKFLANDPEKRRATSGIVQRWTQMVSSYRFIKDWEATRIPGSTGQESWFKLSPVWLLKILQELTSGL